MHTPNSLLCNITYNVTMINSLSTKQFANFTTDVQIRRFKWPGIQVSHNTGYENGTTIQLPLRIKCHTLTHNRFIQSMIFSIHRLLNRMPAPLLNTLFTSDCLDLMTEAGVPPSRARASAVLHPDRISALPEGHLTKPNARRLSL